jgi:ubiquinol-cytochrome c reductase cytochrome b subunit
MGGAIVILLALPIINTSKIRSSKFRPIFRFLYWFWVADFLILGWIGQKPVESPYVEVGVCATIFYFVFLLIIIPVVGLIEEFLLKQASENKDDFTVSTEQSKYEIKL